MKGIVYLTTFALTFSACKQQESTSTEKSITQDGRTVVGAEQAKTPAHTTGLDSIDKANNESVIAAGDNITKAYVSASDSSISLTANIRQDHRIFGYERPDNKSSPLLLLSVFTSDIQNNPFRCKLGAYYDTSGMENLKMSYLSTVDDFVKVAAINTTGDTTIMYFEKKWIEFE